MNSTWVWRLKHRPWTLPLATSSAAAGGAVARVVVSHTSGQSRPHRQRRLRAIKRLNL